MIFKSLATASDTAHMNPQPNQHFTESYPKGSKYPIIRYLGFG